MKSVKQTQNNKRKIRKNQNQYNDDEDTFEEDSWAGWAYEENSNFDKKQEAKKEQERKKSRCKRAHIKKRSTLDKSKKRKKQRKILGKSKKREKKSSSVPML